MCKLFLALAFSYHISVTTPNTMNFVHPNAGMDCPAYEIGLFYNSEYRASVYMGKKFTVTPESYVEAGIVNGYSTVPVLPYVRYIHGKFFVFPTVYTHRYEVNYSIEKKIYPMLVVGVNFRI